MKRLLTIVALAGALATGGACSSTSPSPASTTTPAATTTAAPTTHNTPAPETTSGDTGSGDHTAPSPAPNPPPNPTPGNQGDRGADGSTGNNLSEQYCAQNQDPGCPAGSYVGPNAIPDPDGDGSYVPCEGTICTNPNHGAGTDPNENGGDSSLSTTGNTSGGDTQGRVAGAPCDDGAGTWVHLEGGNAAHYGTEWLCRH
ncbi:hypothetical protein G4X40_10825 [Rhodococcus sp. D2-41]|uniref:Excalibur calcium-binding domain-containing protein n=1 Tax=Speluncibacter jeojiensis TaxID=2710754 RepID=A0A9X4RFA6_9ACTN|nr:hypothetical protein [Rhodococcus sp. D2-41]MDG3010642.1 hypothetical protein [Rhodococcus sp. D2-41]MDG3016820.1 hypothetical protein [Corynebacteriales bacterium D3-21]